MAGERREEDPRGRRIGTAQLTSSSGRPPKDDPVGDPTALSLKISMLQAWGFPEWGSSQNRPRTRFLRLVVNCPAAMPGREVGGRHGEVFLSSPLAQSCSCPDWDDVNGTPWEATFMLDYSRWRARCGSELVVLILDKGLIGGETLVGSFGVELSGRQFWTDPTGTPEDCTFAVRGEVKPGGTILPAIRGGMGLGERTLGAVVGDMKIRMSLSTADHRHFVPIDTFAPSRTVLGRATGGAAQLAGAGAAREEREERWSAVHRVSSRLQTPTIAQQVKYRQKPQPPAHTQFRESGAVNNLALNLIILDALAKSNLSNNSKWRSFIK